MIIESYKALFRSKGVFWMFGLDTAVSGFFNSFVNLTLDFDRLIYMIFSWIIEMLANPTFFTNLTTQMTDMTKIIFQNLKDNLLPYVFALVVGCMVLAFSKRRIHDVIKILMEFVIVLFLALFFIHNTTPVIQGSFQVMDEVSAKIVTGISFKKDVSDVQEETTGTAALVEQYKEGLFREMVADPWAIINFGRSYSDDVRIADEDGKEHGMKDFLIEKTDDIKVMYSRSKEIDELVNRTPNIWFVDRLGTKFLIGLLSCVNALKIGLFVTFMVLLTFFLKIGIMSMYVILPVVLFMEMIPAFRGLLTKFVGMIINLFMQSVVMQLVVFIMLFFFSVLNAFATDFVSYLGVVVLKLVIVVIGWKLFPKLLLMLGLGSSGFTRGKQHLRAGVALAASGLTGGTGAAVSLIKKRQEKKEAQREELKEKAISARGLIQQTARLKSGYDMSRFEVKNVTGGEVAKADRIYQEVPKPKTKNYADAYKMVDRSQEDIPAQSDTDGMGSLPVIRQMDGIKEEYQKDIKISSDGKAKNRVADQIKEEQRSKRKYFGKRKVNHQDADALPVIQKMEVSQKADAGKEDHVQKVYVNEGKEDEKKHLYTQTVRENRTVRTGSDDQRIYSKENHEMKSGQRKVHAGLTKQTGVSERLPAYKRRRDVIRDEAFAFYDKTTPVAVKPWKNRVKKEGVNGRTQ